MMGKMEMSSMKLIKPWMEPVESELLIPILDCLSIVNGRFEMVNVNSCLKSRGRVLRFFDSVFGECVARRISISSFSPVEVTFLVT